MNSPETFDEAFLSIMKGCAVIIALVIIGAFSGIGIILYYAL